MLMLRRQVTTKKINLCPEERIFFFFIMCTEQRKRLTLGQLVCLYYISNITHIVIFHTLHFHIFSFLPFFILPFPFHFSFSSQPTIIYYTSYFLRHYHLHQYSRHNFFSSGIIIFSSTVTTTYFLSP